MCITADADPRFGHETYAYVDVEDVRALLNKNGFSVLDCMGKKLEVLFHIQIVADVSALIIAQRCLLYFHNFFTFY